MKSLPTLLLLTILLVPATGEAGKPSGHGVSPLPSNMGHNVGVGWPSLSYDWWNKGSPDWALGAELVYGDWSGSHTDVEIGFAVNGRFRWRLSQNKRASVGLQMSPGVMFATTEGPVDLFVLGLRGEIAIPVSISLHPRVNLLTGGTIPFTVVIIEDIDPFVVLPLMARIGVEITAQKWLVPWLLLEVGPGIAFGDGGTDTEFAFRVAMGVTFW